MNVNLPNPYDRDGDVAVSRTPVVPTATSGEAFEVVIVDPRIDRYGDFVAAANEGRFGLHFCSDAQSAVKLARRFRADVWLLNADLPDMGDFDLISLLADQVSQGDVDPLRGGHRTSLSRVGTGRHSGIFVVADEYRLEDEQRALAAGVAGYLVRPIAVELVQALRYGPYEMEFAQASV